MLRKSKSLKIGLFLIIALTACSQNPPNTNNTQPNPTSSPTVGVNPDNPSSTFSSESQKYLYSINNPSWSPDNSKIVFNYGYKIYTSDPQGKNNVLLIDLKQEFNNLTLISPLNFSWSPKGDKIAFTVVSSNEGNPSQGNLYVIDINTKNIYKNKDIYYTAFPNWLPNGTDILINSKEEKSMLINTSNNTVSILKDETGKDVVVGIAGFPQVNRYYVSPDGNKVIITATYNKDNLVMYDLKTKKLNVIYDKKSSTTYSTPYINWSADSKNIILQTQEQVKSLNILNVETKEIKTLNNNENILVSKYSNDGTKIASFIFDSSPSFRLKIFNIEKGQSEYFDHSSKEGNYIYSLNWSPDNTKILITCALTSYVFDVVTKKFIVLDNVSVSHTNLSFPQWSNDSQKIFYSDKASEPFVTDLTGNKTPLYVRPVNPLVTQFNIKSPTQSEIDEANSSKVIESNSKFALKMFSELSDKEGNKNLFISPLSMSLALSMTYNGAGGNTEKQMLETLEYKGLSKDAVNKNNNTLLRLLLTDQDIQLSIANAIFTKKGYIFKQDFMNLNKTNYFSELNELPGSEVESLEMINKWVSDKTNNKIPSILKDIDPDDIIYLLNAIYFKGGWTKVFEKDLTQDKTFNMADGSSKNVPMMNQEGSYTHFKDNETEFIRLPYGNSKRMGMYVFLPSEGTKLDDFRKNITIEKMDKWLAYKGMERGNISIPKFKLEYETNLIPHLKNLGMTDAFDKSKADFTNMTNTDMFLTKAIQKTFVEVNEEGTEAAAVTAIVGGTTSVPPPPFRFVADRPFIYSIVDERTNSILFIGSVYEPI